MHSLAQRVLSHIRREELLGPGDRVGVAVSGGIDSVALLRLLLESRGELGIVLSVVHFNHKLRGAESDADQEFVAGLAREHGLELYVDGDDVAQHAAGEHISVEAAARELRYGFFRYLLNEDGQGLTPLVLPSAPLRGAEAPLFHGLTHGDGVGPSQGGSACGLPTLSKIATGHTLDDQAETVLMRVVRGTGLRGLGGIYPRVVVEGDGDETGTGEEASGEIIRPLLAFRRRELEQYLREIKQLWREDSTNADNKFTRNRMRHLVLPLLEEEFNPAVSENLAELAEIARGEEDYWENEVSGWLGTVVQWTEPEWSRALSARDSLVQIQLDVPLGREASSGESSSVEADEPDSIPMDASVDRRWLLGEPMAVQRRLVKAIGEHVEITLEFKHVEEVLRFAADAAATGKKLSLPLGWTALVEAEALIFMAPDPRRKDKDADRDEDSQQKDLPRDYEYPLTAPGRVSVPEIGSVMEALRVAAETAGYNPEHLLDGELLRGPMRVRNWRPGDRFWPAHTKGPKKIKELLQELHVAQPERGLWPVVTSGDEIVWVRGFVVPAKLRAKAGEAGVLIRETPRTKDESVHAEAST